MEKVNKKILMPTLAVFFVALMICPAMATPPNQSEFDYWQDYSGWGPALYYGQYVNIHHVSVNTWVLNIWDNGDGTWTIRQELTQNGKAYVYDVDGNLIDTKNFRVVEVTQGIVSYEASWYHVYSLQDVEKWEYHWIITSVYHYWGRAHDNAYQFDYWVKGVGWIHLYP